MIDSPPFDWIIVRGIALRQRPSRSQKTSIENSSPRQTLLHERVDRRRVEVEGELLGVVGAVDVPRAEALAHLHEQRVARVRRARRRAASCAGSGSRAPRRRDARAHLSPIAPHTSGSGTSTSAGARPSRGRESEAWSRSVERDDEPDVVLGHERGERGDVLRDRPRAGRAPGGGRGRAPGRAGRASAATVVAPARPKARHDVDTLARAGEEDGGHLDVGGYPALPPAYDADTRPQSTRNGSSTATNARSAAATTNAEPRPGGRRTSTTNAAPIAPAGSAISRYVPLIVSPSVDG